ncbi:MAG: hypothetical protein KDE03_00290 [Rhodobacteraceae bacterium]|nr:hypothetical protein [Paracoccaceae bacterium]
MHISRNYLIIGSLYLVLGIFLGMYMGGSGDHSLAPLHAHINLLGFALMTLFGILYRVIPAMADSVLARVQFWLHQIGAVVLLVMLFLLLSGRITEAAMVPITPLAEFLVLLSVLAYAVNLWRSA